MRFKYISEDKVPLRLDRFLNARLTNLSRTQLKNQITSLSVNGNPVKLSYKIRAFDKISVELKKPNNNVPGHTELSVKIIYQDEDILIVHKLPGQIVYSSNPSVFTFANYLQNIIKNIKSFDDPSRAGIVHRLDKDTEGILICAKTPFAERHIKDQFRLRKVKKIYFALVQGTIYQTQDVITKPIDRHPRKWNKRITSQSGKSAETVFQVISRFNDHTLLRVELKTGRTHQVRVHFSSIGHPLCGDRLYSRNARDYNYFCLCAKEITFSHPKGNQPKHFSIDLPKEFNRIIDKMTYRK